MFEWWMKIYEDAYVHARENPGWWAFVYFGNFAAMMTVCISAISLLDKGLQKLGWVSKR